MSEVTKFPDVSDIKQKLADRLKVVSEENEEKRKVFMSNKKGDWVYSHGVWHPVYKW